MVYIVIAENELKVIFVSGFIDFAYFYDFSIGYGNVPKVK
jgi:hypothetical protein